VTEEMKYLYWGYAEKGFKPSNELYDLKKDPLEKSNQFSSSEYTKARKKMQKLYDQHLAHWKESAVAYNNYQIFGVLFDRKLEWDEKLKRVKNHSFN
jgi:hypothetical protein